MKVQVQLPGILGRLPQGWSLPATFLPFAEFCAQHRFGELGWFHVKWTDPKRLFEADVKPDVVPFMRLPDGGIIGFWFAGKAAAPAVILADSEGGRRVIAKDWSDFVSRLARGKTAVPDLDDRELSRVKYPFAIGRRSAALGSLNRAFDAWVERQRPKAASIDPGTSEGIRRQLLKVMRDHKHIDRLIGTTLFVTLGPRAYHVMWLDGGERPYPAAAQLAEPLRALSAALGRPLKHSELHVWADGLVILEKQTLLGSAKHQAKWRAKLGGG